MIRCKGYGCLIMTIKTPHYNSMACYNREFHFNGSRIHGTVLFPASQQNTLTTEYSLTNIISGRTVQNCPYSHYPPGLPLYTSHISPNSVHGHLVFMVLSTPFWIAYT